MPFGVLHEAVFPAPDCPARGYRVKGVPTGRPFGQTLDPAPTRTDLGACGEDEQD